MEFPEFVIKDLAKQLRIDLNRVKQGTPIEDI